MASAFSTDLENSLRGVALAVHGEPGWSYTSPAGGVTALSAGLICDRQVSEQDDEQDGDHVLRRIEATGSAADVALPAERGSLSDGTDSYEIATVQGLPGGLWRAGIVRSGLQQKTLRRGR